MFGWVVGIVFFLLLLSAANTAIVAMIGLLYMMARDREMPAQFRPPELARRPQIPLLVGVGPARCRAYPWRSFTALAGLYAIGVVGAITVNLGSCCFNRALGFKLHDRVFFGVTFAILCLVEITLARTKPDALFFVVCVLWAGLALRPSAKNGTASPLLPSHIKSPKWFHQILSRPIAAALAGRPKDHGRGARHHAGARLRP